MIAGSDMLFVNGINAYTGQYDVPPLQLKDLADRLIKQAIDRDDGMGVELRSRTRRLQSGSFGLKEGFDDGDLGQAGWGVIFSAAADPALREALSELLNLRREQAGARYRECIGPTGYRPGETMATFLARQGVVIGQADPDKYPYYLLIVGGPEEIPYRFQQQLDVQYAVGRIHFDTPEEYRTYARSVVAVERGEVRLPRRLACFSPRHPDDSVTEQIATKIIGPLSAELDPRLVKDGWQIDTGAEATRARLVNLLGGAETPALLVAGGHSAIFVNADDPRQRAQQGALICQGWDGLGAALKPEHYVSADDLPADARLLGSVAVLLGSYSAGTFNPGRRDLADLIRMPQPLFSSRLAQRMLSHPHGGALAVIGMADRFWSAGLTGGDRPVFQALSNTIQRICQEGRIGAALEYVSNLYAEVAVALSEDLENVRFGAVVDPRDLVSLWALSNDASNLCIIGDPAVRLPVARGAAPVERAIIPEVLVSKGLNLEPAEALLGSTGETAGETPAPAERSAEPVTDESPPRVPLGVSFGDVTISNSYDPVPNPPGSEMSFGSFGSGLASLYGTGSGGSRLTAASDRLMGIVEGLLDDLNVLDVETYVSDSVPDARLQSGNVEGGTLLATSRVFLDGDTKQVLPNRASEERARLLDLHQRTLEIALAERTRMLTALAQIISELSRK